MTQPMIAWCVIAGVLLSAFIFRALERYFMECRRQSHHAHAHLVEIGKEREIFYIPGDVDEEEDYEEEQ